MFVFPMFFPTRNDNIIISNQGPCFPMESISVPRAPKKSLGTVADYKDRHPLVSRIIASMAKKAPKTVCGRWHVMLILPF